MARPRFVGKSTMRLADFILSNLEPVLGEWEVFARTIGAGKQLDQLALRDHAGQILHATAEGMTHPRAGTQAPGSSTGERPSAPGGEALVGASDLHAADRLGLGFDMLEVMSEYRALRASVLRLWHASGPAPNECSVDDVARFNESIDQSLAEAVASYTRRVDQARDMFLAILSHDLRNPLNSIAMTAHAVPHLAGDPAEALECSHQIVRSVSVMERMISDLLDYTRTRLGAGMPVKPAPLDLAELAGDLFAEFRASFPGRDIRFRTDGDLHGLWDSDRIRQAMSNLLGNAIQHGSVDFPVVLSLRGTPPGVDVEVHNGGDPIRPAELPKIFDPLVRGSSADHPRKNRPGSIGMGLYIAREVAKSHGGRIEVTSTAATGRGSAVLAPHAGTHHMNEYLRFVGEASAPGEHHPERSRTGAGAGRCRLALVRFAAGAAKHHAAAAAAVQPGTEPRRAAVADDAAGRPEQPGVQGLRRAVRRGDGRMAQAHPRPTQVNHGHGLVARLLNGNRIRGGLWVHPGSRTRYSVPRVKQLLPVATG